VRFFVDFYKIAVTLFYMNSTSRTSRYIGTLQIDGTQENTLSVLRNYLVGSDFRLSLHGRGPRKHLTANGYSRSMLQSNLPLKFAKSVDIYLRPKEGGFSDSSFTSQLAVVVLVQALERSTRRQAAIRLRNAKS
jgi:hypothetical protein